MTEHSESDPQDERDRENAADEEGEAFGGNNPSRTKPEAGDGGGSAPDDDEDLRHSDEWEAGWSGP